MEKGKEAGNKKTETGINRASINKQKHTKQQKRAIKASKEEELRRERRWNRRFLREEIEEIISNEKDVKKENETTKKLEKKGRGREIGKRGTNTRKHT